MANDEAIKINDAVDVVPTVVGQLVQDVTSPHIPCSADCTFSFPKRVVDVVGSLLLIFSLLPLLVILAVLVRSDGGPAFYGQYRIGHGGRQFRLWKLRSMVPDADIALDLHFAGDVDAKAEWDANQKLQSDPRVTPLGRKLRKYSLDELPQFFNVLCGDMSLIGPRPMMIDQERLYPGVPYAGLRPGLTGLWQISKREDVTFAARARYDAEYAANMSLRQDLKIAFLTIGYLFAGRGC